MFSSNTTQVSAGGGYEIQRSLRFNSADTAYLNRTPASAGNRKTWTWSGWVKRGRIGNVSNLFNTRGDVTDAQYFRMGFGIASPDTFFVSSFNSTTIGLETTALFRDPSAWYHVVFAFDTTQATASNRMKLYVNGVQQTAFGTANYPSQNFEAGVNTTVEHAIGRILFLSNTDFDGYMTEVNFIDGQALTPSSFGEFSTDTGVWQPKRYAGSYGTNGFYLNFSNNSNTTAATLGADYSGNGNNWTPNNFSVSAGAGNDSLVDSPTSYGTDTGVGGTVRGNYSTLNPLQQLSSLPSNGNLFVETNGNVGNSAIRNTLGLLSGKWYFEVTVSTNYPGNWNAGVVELTGASNAITTSSGDSASKFAFILGGGTAPWYKKTNSTLTTISPSGCADGTVMSVAVDLDSGKMWVAKNNTWADSGNPSAGTNAQFTSIPSDTYLISAFPYKDSAGNISFNCNFGQRPFAYTAPSGFKALNTQNLPTPTIGATTATQAGKFFAPVTYTGNGTTQTISVGFQPDLVWIKNRANTSDHGLFDVLRGVTRRLSSNTTAVEDTISGLTAFTSDGFTIGSDYNNNGLALMSWNWRASNAAAVTNTAGSITSTVSANTTSGFSIATFTGNGTAGATFGHGLGVAPRMIIIKSRGNARNWLVYHASIGATQFLQLDTTIAATTGITPWNNTAPTSSVVTLGTSAAGNESGITRVAYCFAEVPGYSKFGSYTGNGSTDGPFVFCGFRPRYIMVKGSTNSSNWTVIDTARDSYNTCTSGLYPNLSAAQSDPGAFDILSNGFKIRHVFSDSNGNGNTYIFAAFAESPQKFALAR